MLSFTGSLKVFVALEPCDMRKGFEGLAGLVAEKLKEDLRSGALFVFCNKRHTRLKVLYFDGTGLWLMTKRLEEGTFSWPKSSEITEENAAQAQEIKLLREKVDLLIKRLFGRSSEKLDEAQLMLRLQGDDDAAKKDQASSRANPGALEAEIEKRAKDDKSKAPSSRQEREARVPEHLPAVDEVIEPDEVKADPQSYRHIGEEITVQLDYSPPRYFRRRIIRKKYVKVDEPRQPPIIAALHTLQERSIAGPGLLASYVKKLLENTKVSRFLKTRHEDLFSEFEILAAKELL